ncbi:Retrovirus-related Pol polyprotein from transposon 17.6, partial [Mucuna pruriens]
MCDASNSALGAILSQRVGVSKLAHVIAYVSRTMDLAQLNYTTTKKELLAIVFALDKFRSYLLGSKIIVFFYLVTLQFLQKEPDVKSRLIRWTLLFQEFNIKIKDKKGAENSIANNLSSIERETDQMPIRDDFPDEQLLQLDMSTPWFADIYNFVAVSTFPPEASRLYKEKITSDAKYYIWDDPYLGRLYNDQVMRRCIPDSEINLVLHFCHAAFGGDHYGSTWTARKVLDCGFYWSTIFRDAYQFVSACKQWSFPVSNGYSYIFLVVDYVLRWVEGVATKTNAAKVVVDFLKSNIFYQFGVPKALISDHGSHFYNRVMTLLLKKYRVVH